MQKREALAAMQAATLQMQEEQMWRWQRVRRLLHRACDAAARVAVLWLLRWAAAWLQQQQRLLLRPPLVAVRSQQQQQPSRQPQPPSA